MTSLYLFQATFRFVDESLQTCNKTISATWGCPELLPTTVRLDPEIKALLELISADMHLKAAQVIRHAIKELARLRGISVKKKEGEV